MVDHAHHVFQPGDPKRMIKRRGRVKQNERCAENGARGHRPGVASQRGERHEHAQAGDAQQQARAMSEAVGDFFAPRVNTG